MTRIKEIVIAGLSLLIMSILAGCAAQTPTRSTPTISAGDYLQMAGNAQGSQRQEMLLKATNRYLENRNILQAQQTLNQVNSNDLPPNLQAKRQLLQANVYVLENRTKKALTLLKAIQNNYPMLPQSEETALLKLLSFAYNKQGKIIPSIQASSQLQAMLSSANAKKNNLDNIITSLQEQTPQALQNIVTQNNSANIQGWAELALIIKDNRRDPSLLASRLEQWRKQFPHHMASTLLPNNLHAAMKKAPAPKKIALLLPLSGRYKNAANAIRNGFFAAYYNAKKTNVTTPTITVYNTATENIDKAYRQAIASGADFVVGPLTKANVKTLASSTSLEIPTLALNTVENKRAIPNLYQFGLSPVDEAQQAATKAWSGNHHNALIIAPAGNWGQNIAKAFLQQWQQLGGLTVGQLNYSNQRTLDKDIKQLLNINKAQWQAAVLKKLLREKFRFVPRRRKDFDMIFLIARPVIARQIKPLLKFYFAGQVPVYSISQIYNGTPNARSNRDLDGIIFCGMPWVLTPKTMQPSWLNTVRQNAKSIWRRSFDRNTKLYALGVDAFDMIAQLNKMTLLPQLGTEAASGTLYLTPTQHLFRKLLWVQMRNGRPQLLRS